MTQTRYRRPALLAIALVLGLTPVGSAGAVEVLDQELLPVTGYAGDEFGTSIAAHGNRIAVGAYFDDGAGPNAGAVTVFAPDQDGGYTTTRLTAADASGSDHLGFAVDADADTVVAGAFGKDAGAEDSGAAYVFSDPEGDGTYVQTRLTAADADRKDKFGFAVGVDAGMVVVGAYFDDEAGVNAGAAYVFTDPEGDGTWQQTKLMAADAAAGDYFGYSVAVHDGVVVVGADASDGAGSSSGSAYVFTDSDADGTWEQVKLTATDAAAGDYFGRSVAIHDGIIAVGADGSDAGASSAGAAYVYADLDGDGVFSEDKLTAEVPGDTAYLGYDVAVTAGRVAAGAYHDPATGPDSGAVHVFTGSPGAWDEAKIVADTPSAGDYFGTSVALGRDTLLIGVPGHDGGGNSAGAAISMRLPAIDENTIDDGGAEPTDPTAEGPGDEPADQPAGEPADEPADQPADEADPDPADEPADAPADQPADDTDPDPDPAGEPTTDDQADQPADDPVDETEDADETPEADETEDADESPEAEEHVGPRARIRLLADQIAQQGDGTGLDYSKHDVKDLDKILDRLDAAYDRGWTSTDTLDDKDGKKVFDGLRHAVKAMEKVDSIDTSAWMAEATDIADHLAASTIARVEDARALADCAEVDCDKADDQLQKAREELADARAELADDDMDKAVDKDRKSWDRAMKALSALDLR